MVLRVRCERSKGSVVTSHLVHGQDTSFRNISASAQLGALERQTRPCAGHVWKACRVKDTDFAEIDP